MNVNEDIREEMYEDGEEYDMPTREEMMSEAIKRMKELCIDKEAIDAYTNGKVYVSSSTGRFIWADAEEQEMIDRFEEENDVLVYHAIFTRTAYCRFFSMLFVSQYKEDWQSDMNDIRHGCPTAMVINIDDEMFSGMGGIGIKQVSGRLERTE